MNFEKTKEVAELIGMAAIVGSLIFVGLQLKQSQDIALATQYQARADATHALTLAHIEADYLVRVPALRAGLSDEVSAADVNTYLWLWIQMDNHYYQYQAGFLSEETWQAQLRNTQGIYADCAMRFVYEWRKNGLRRQFVELVESLEDPCAAAD
jgi:hypothetical protein